MWKKLSIVFNIFFYSEEDQLDSALHSGRSDALCHCCLPCIQLVSDAVLKNQEEMLTRLQAICATLEKMSDSLASITANKI